MLEWLYLICLCLLAVYGANSAVLTLIYWFKPRQPAPGEPLASLSLRPTLGEGSGVREPAAWPTVTVQLPVYNERYVVERLLDAVGALDYPADRLQIQVLDDSTDETCAIIDRVTARLRARGKEVAVIRRARKTGFKGGALAAGTAEARGEFIAIFDADFLPPPGFLKQTIPHLSGARVGCVQTRWGHVNADYSLLTRLQAAGIDGHFMVEQEARNRMGWFIGFNGSAGVWRKACIESAGGWQTDTLTEDLDLSYRAQLAGWTFKFLTDVVAPAEVPAQMDAYRRQQFRWAKGSVQTAKKLLPALWRAPLSPAVKLQGTLHLTGYLMHLLMVIAFVLTVPVSLVQSPVLALLPYLALTMVGPFCLYGTAVWRRSRSVLNLLGTLVMLVVLGTGMSINNARAAVEALLGINSAFRRTPKFDLRSRADQWRASRYSLPNDPMVWAELSAAALAIGYTANALWHHGLVNDWLLIYALAYSYVSSLSLYQGLGRALIRRRAMPPSAAE